MKRFLLIIPVLIIFMFIFSCGSNTTPTTTSNALASLSVTLTGDTSTVLTIGDTLSVTVGGTNSEGGEPDDIGTISFSITNNIGYLSQPVTVGKTVTAILYATGNGTGVIIATSSIGNIRAISDSIPVRDIVRIEFVPNNAQLNVNDTLEIQVIGHSLTGESGPISDLIWSTISNYGTISPSVSGETAIFTAVKSGEEYLSVQKYGSPISGLSDSFVIYPMSTPLFESTKDFAFFSYLRDEDYILYDVPDTNVDTMVYVKILDSNEIVGEPNEAVLQIFNDDIYNIPKEIAGAYPETFVIGCTEGRPTRLEDKSIIILEKVQSKNYYMDTAQIVLTGNIKNNADTIIKPSCYIKLYKTPRADTTAPFSYEFILVNEPDTPITNFSLQTGIETNIAVTIDVPTTGTYIVEFVVRADSDNYNTYWDTQYYSLEYDTVLVETMGGTEVESYQILNLYENSLFRNNSCTYITSGLDEILYQIDTPAPNNNISKILYVSAKNLVDTTLTVGDAAKLNLKDPDTATISFFLTDFTNSYARFSVTSPTYDDLIDTEIRVYPNRVNYYGLRDFGDSYSMVPYKFAIATDADSFSSTLNSASFVFFDLTKLNAGDLTIY